MQSNRVIATISMIVRTPLPSSPTLHASALQGPVWRSRRSTRCPSSASSAAPVTDSWCRRAASEAAGSTSILGERLCQHHKGITHRRRDEVLLTDELVTFAQVPRLRRGTHGWSRRARPSHPASPSSPSRSSAPACAHRPRCRGVVDPRGDLAAPRSLRGRGPCAATGPPRKVMVDRAAVSAPTTCACMYVSRGAGKRRRRDPVPSRAMTCRPVLDRGSSSARGTRDRNVGRVPTRLPNRSSGPRASGAKSIRRARPARGRRPPRRACRTPIEIVVRPARPFAPHRLMPSQRPPRYML